MTIWNDGLPTLVIGLPSVQDKGIVFTASKTWSLIPNKEDNEVFNQEQLLESGTPSPYSLLGMLIYDLNEPSKSGMVSTGLFLSLFHGTL